ncbi:hypothetical protein QJS10_CPB04g01201 [Acorus calamus]|uniref:Uncharacterized protein n=1 Tax=Acorus calamus TaxID=4465 RepID=A0AAV9F1E6_ACOCL|nr:hypothetical protein QJS10_CPB04g01201 [Acorus calamus]
MPGAIGPPGGGPPPPLPLGGNGVVPPSSLGGDGGFVSPLVNVFLSLGSLGEDERACTPESTKPPPPREGTIESIFNAFSMKGKGAHSFEVGTTSVLLENSSAVSLAAPTVPFVEVPVHSHSHTPPSHRWLGSVTWVDPAKIGRLKVITRRNDQHLMLLYVPSREAVQGRLGGWLVLTSRLVWGG